MELRDKIHPPRTALLIVDIQNDFFLPGGVVDRMGHDYRSCEAIIEPLGSLIARARDLLPLVVWTKQTRYPYLRGPVVQEQYGRAGMAGTEVPEALGFYRLRPVEGDVVLEKHKDSAFVGTFLDGMLKANSIKTVIVTGVATNVCVEATVRDAFMLEYHVVVPSDLVAGVSEEFKAMSLANIDMFYGHVVVSADILAAWDGVGAA